MTIANTCVVIAALMPVLTVGLAKGTGIGKKVRNGGYDNNNPRSWEASLQGWPARAKAAQDNGFEALPLFAFAVLAAQLAALPQARTDHLAMAFIALRVAYVAIYLANVGTLRTLIWFAATVTAVAIVAPALSFAL
jgi:uncharacterized MAPEG superfamily protein